MKRLHGKIKVIMILLSLVLGVINPINVCASSFKINLKENQLFYILPGNDKVNYNIKLTSGNQLGNEMLCTTSNPAKATISNKGDLTIVDAGSFKVSVTYNNETITRTVQALLRTDWRRVINVANASKITVANNHVATYKIQNLMDFPLKVTMHYSTYKSDMSLMESDKLHDYIYLAANETIAYKEIVPENVKYITVDSATFEYDQYGLDKINTKKVAIKENISNSKKPKNTKIIKETVTNTNSVNVLVPYETYVYDENGKIASISYNKLKVLAGQKNVFQNKYYTKKPAGQAHYSTKIVYKFFAPIPEF